MDNETDHNDGRSGGWLADGDRHHHGHTAEANPGNENPGNENPGNENPGNENPGGEGPGEDERLAVLVEELDDTDAILERVRRRGIPEDIAHGLRPRGVPRGGDSTPPAPGV